ncbi:hypothetical protein os1_25440 [Comamonadaceae bacterium OS-1]|nr:hypothetical protein os1_25440 [Comamonadaceae bacterium OS-1]
MSKNLHTSTPETETTDIQSGTSGLASDAMARRRMLLKSLGKGSSVIAAAAIPMHTLAATGTLAKTINGTRCTISSMASGVHSKDTTTEQCIGLKTSKFAVVPTNWPNATLDVPTGSYIVTSVGITSFRNTSPFNTVFGAGITTTLSTILSSAPNSDEAVWITALLNSIICASGITSSGVKNFPYTPAQVIGLYASNPTAAVTFFRTNLQSF